MSGAMREMNFPQGLKPITFLPVIGTAEAVPFQSLTDYKATR